MAAMARTVAKTVASAPSSPTQLQFFQWLYSNERLRCIWNDDFIGFLADRLIIDPPANVRDFWDDFRRTFAGKLRPVANPDTATGRALLLKLVQKVVPEFHIQSLLDPVEAAFRSAGLLGIDEPPPQWLSVSRPLPPLPISSYPLHSQLGATSLYSGQRLGEFVC